MPELSRSLRDAFGCFATGICVVTTPLSGPDASPALSPEQAKKSAPQRYSSVTINSFSSVSLDPALLAWSLDLKARRYSVMSEMAGFVVNVLADHQSELAQQAATQTEFEATHWAGQPAEHGWIFDDVVASFDCKLWKKVDAGDHVMFFGKIMSHAFAGDQKPLLYYRGQFATLAESK